jgi:hypothetical protein
MGSALHFVLKSYGLMPVPTNGIVSSCMQKLLIAWQSISSWVS